MPRPRKRDPERKSTRLAVRLTPSERLQIEQAAHDAGVSASAYMRAQVLRGQVSVARHRSLAHGVFDQIRRIGVNLNQLTRLAHQTGALPPELPAVCTAIEDILIRELASGAPPDTDDDLPAQVPAQAQDTPYDDSAP